MSLTLKIDGRNYSVGRARLDGSGEKWILCANSQENPDVEKEICGIWNPLSFPGSDCDPAQFWIAVFTHRNWPESQVLALKEGSRSVGLTFSIQALTSGSAVLTANKMFNDYGFLALSKLCTGDTFCYVG